MASGKALPVEPIHNGAAGWLAGDWRRLPKAAIGAANGPPGATMVPPG